jgi:hypothetical protein
MSSHSLSDKDMLKLAGHMYVVADAINVDLTTTPRVPAHRHQLVLDSIHSLQNFLSQVDMEEQGNLVTRVGRRLHHGTKHSGR